MWDSTLPFRYRRPCWTVGISFTVCLLWLVSRHQPLLPRSRGSALSALITPSTTTGAAQKIRDVRNETLGVRLPAPCIQETCR
jgi:hypothetical protein